MDRAYVYIVSNKRNGAIDVGVTNDIVRLAWEHREGVQPSFTRRYGLKMLV
jgi:putative endonuclease